MRNFLHVFLEKIKKVNIKKIKPADIMAVSVVLVLSCIIIVPSLTLCVANRQKKDCSRHIYSMLGILSSELESEQAEGSSYWHDMIKNGNYQKLIIYLNDKTNTDKFPSSDYFIQTGNETLSILCKKHKDISEHSIQFSKMRNVDVEIAQKPLISDQIAYLSVIGPDTYYEGNSLDPRNPNKMVFSGLEVDKAIQNLHVYAVYAGGVREEIPRDKYTIMTKRLNMNKSGQTRLIIKYDTDSLWDSSAYTSFVIDVVGDDDVAPLIIDGGNAGIFELASWDWHDYVAEAAAEGEYKDFGASIVRYDGKFYYFPEGMRIVNINKNNSLEYALDVHDPSKPAYNILFDRKSVVTQDEDVSEGSVRIENDFVYIWNDTPLTEVSNGWIRIYCDLKKY